MVMIVDNLGVSDSNTDESRLGKERSKALHYVSSYVHGYRMRIIDLNCLADALCSFFLILHCQCGGYVYLKQGTSQSSGIAAKQAFQCYKCKIRT